MKVTMAAAANVGAMIGTNILKKMPNSPSPSTLAAWTVSMGNDSALWRKKKMRNAVEMVGRMKPIVVSKSLAWLNMRKSGTISAAKGTIMESKSNPIRVSLPFSR